VSFFVSTEQAAPEAEMSTTMTNPRFTRGAPAAAMADPGQRPSTDGQIKFLVDLVKQIAQFDVERGRSWWMALRARQEAGLTFGESSALIDSLKAERNELRAAKSVSATPTRPKIPEGRYAVDTDEGHLGFYRVRVSDKGFITVAVMASDEEHELPWRTALGVLRKIEVDTPLAALIRYGKEIHVCGVCGRTLTKQSSRDAGIGPICIDRL
jgi:hypothetical protein